MARITVNDCLEQVPNRFDLVLMAAERARQIALGTPSVLDEINQDKPTVLALREIAAGLLNSADPDKARAAAAFKDAAAASSGQST